MSTCCVPGTVVGTDTQQGTERLFQVGKTGHKLMTDEHVTGKWGLESDREEVLVGTGRVERLWGHM